LAAAAPPAAATATYSCIGTGNTAGTGNISVDPLFADAAGGDFHLKSQRGRLEGSRWVRDAQTSPCINAGDPAGDFSAEPMPNGGRVNMGAFGSTNQASMSGNTAPAVTSVSISPDPAYTDDDLTATPSGWNDPDGDPEGYGYQWAKHDGSDWVDIPGATTDTLSSTNFIKDDQLRVTCTPDDGAVQGAPVTDEITISNTAPTVASVTLGPDPAGTGDDITAIPSGWSDPDGDAEGYTYGWMVNGGMLPGVTTATLTSDHFVKGDLVQVVCRPNDGTDLGTLVNDQLTVANTAPTLAAVNITPNPAQASDDLTANPSGWSDADSDAEGYQYQWAKWDGSAWQDLAGQTDPTLLASNFAKGDIVRVTCTPDDGTDTGGAATDAITIGNLAPSVASVAISPDPAYGWR